MPPASPRGITKGPMPKTRWLPGTLTGLGFALLILSCDDVEGTDCTDVLAEGGVPPILRCFGPRQYRCDVDSATWRWETCCYCRETTRDSPGGSYCTPTCLDTGLPTE